MLGGLLLGPWAGFLIGTLGSSLADIAAGYAFYTPFTFIAKDLEGFIAGFFYRRNHHPWLATMLGGLMMALVFWLTDSLLYNIGMATALLPFNLFQGFVGALIANLLHQPICRALNQEW